MREIVGWTCAIILGVTMVVGVIAGAIEAWLSDDPLAIVILALLVMTGLGAGAVWGLGL